MFWKLVRWSGLAVLSGLILLVASSCTMLGMNYASLDTDNKPWPEPPLDLAELGTEEGREALRRRFEASLYGPWPEGLAVSWTDWQLIDADYLSGRGTLEQRIVTLGEGAGARNFALVLAMPKAAGPLPVVISQTFASNCAVFPDQPIVKPDGTVCAGSEMDGTLGRAARFVFGEFIAEAPVARYFDAGLAYASFHASEAVPDSRVEGPSVMAALGGPVTPTSALMAWAFAYSAAADALSDDQRIDPQRLAVLGHSRHGKAALIAAAWDERLAAVVAHQAGFAGTALSRSRTGERLSRMAKTYPHWLAPEAQAFAEAPDDLPVDQHQLIALIAPRPVLIGNARRDVWSDPNSSFRAARAASQAWTARGADGLTHADMTRFDPSARLSWWLRPGGHSVVSRDIDAFTAFLTAHLAGDRPLSKPATQP